MRGLLACLLLSVCACGPVAAADLLPLRIGDVAADLQFKDIRFVARSLRDLGESSALVLVFANTTCPIVQKYWPKLNRLSAEFHDRNVQFVAVNVGSDDDLSEIAQQALDFGITFPTVKDVDGASAAALGIERTPQVAVLDASRRLRYRGRIDDQYRIGGARPQVTRDDLKLALEDLLAGRDVAVAETPVDGCLITRQEFVPPAVPVTYYEHVLPVLQRHCQDCHHAGGSAPFALQTLDEVRSQAETIAEVVAERRMPPWHASRRQTFHNERGLSASERALLTAWVKTGATAGDERQAPPPRTFENTGWEIGTPDLTTTAFETHKLPADGFIDYRYVILPYIFVHDTWISAAEIRPSNPKTVHHCNMAYLSIGKQFDDGNFITGRVPGGTAMVLDDGVALKIPRNSVIGLQIHYTTTGKPEENRMSVGFRFPRGVVRQELRHLQVTTSRFAIPPGAPAHPVSATRTLPHDAVGIGMFSHMHLRGKDMTFTARTPAGETETLLTIPNYLYNWQQNYRWTPGEKKFPKGTQIEVLAHFDNSAFNPFNPDPAATVKYGPQTVHEMMFGFFFYVNDGEDLNLRIDPKTGAALSE